MGAFLPTLFCLQFALSTFAMTVCPHSGRSAQVLEVLQLLLRALAIVQELIRVTDVLALALDPHLTVSSDPTVCAAFKVQRRPNFVNVNAALEADNQVRVLWFYGKAGVV